MKKPALIFVIIILVVVSVVYSSHRASAFLDSKAAGYRQVNAHTAKKLMAQNTGYTILDVRTQEEYAKKHIPGAVLIPDYEISNRAEKELPDKSQLILVYCRSGNRSKKASQVLADMGYTDVVEFGGIKDWPYETEPKQ